jgi:hypothetical protein
MEAMSAGLVCIHPNFAALPETAANLTAMYNWHEDMNTHAGNMYKMLKNAISLVRSSDADLTFKLEFQKDYADWVYSWKLRAEQWTQLLTAMKDLPRGFEKIEGPKFVYQVK